MNYKRLVNLFLMMSLTILSAVMSVIWHGDNTPYLLRSLIEVFSNIPKAASTMSAPPEHYYHFGRITLLFYFIIFLYLLMIKPRLNTCVAFVSISLLTIAFIGDIGTYWLSDTYGEAFRTIAFWYMEFPSLAILLVYWFSLAGYDSLKLGKVHNMLWLFPFTIIVTGYIQYLPHSFLLVILTAVSFKCFHENDSMKYGE